MLRIKMLSTRRETTGTYEADKFYPVDSDLGHQFIREGHAIEVAALAEPEMSEPIPKPAPRPASLPRGRAPRLPAAKPEPGKQAQEAPEKTKEVPK